MKKDELICFDNSFKDVLGEFSTQCLLCRNYIEDSDTGCKAYKTMPVDYWLHKKECPKFEDKGKPQGK